MSNASDDLPEPETPVITLNRPRGKRDVDVLQVVLPRASDVDGIQAIGALLTSAPAREGQRLSKHRSVAPASNVPTTLLTA